MAVNFEYYKVFYYVVKYQTISRAAQAPSHPANRQPLYSGFRKRIKCNTISSF